MGAARESICGVAGVDPIVVDVNWIRQNVNCCLIILQTYSAEDSRCFPRLVHLNFAGSFVIAEGTCELRVQRLNRLFALRRLPFALPATHFTEFMTLPGLSFRNKLARGNLLIDNESKRGRGLLYVRDATPWTGHYAQAGRSRITDADTRRFV